MELDASHVIGIAASSQSLPKRAGASMSAESSQMEKSTRSGGRTGLPGRQKILASYMTGFRVRTDEYESDRKSVRTLRLREIRFDRGSLLSQHRLYSSEFRLADVTFPTHFFEIT